MMITRWEPSLKWHLITLGIILAVCWVGFWVLSCVTRHLPPPYQPRTPAQGTTPWNK